MLGDLRRHWRQEAHSDAEVRLIAGTLTSSGGRVVATIPAHAVVLSAASEYFSTLLSPGWTRPGDSQHGSRCRAVISLQVDSTGCVAALIALLRCIYTNDIQLPHDDIEAVMRADAALDGVRSIYEGSIEAVKQLASGRSWQELHMRIIALADQYAVPGVMEVAVSKLTRLFTFQLNWPAVEAVLWMPPALARQDRICELRCKALNYIEQGIQHLDACLVSPKGRHLLQHMPPDALAAVLASDSLAVASENTILAVIDTYLSGPVAHGLAKIHSAAAAAAAVSTNGSYGSCGGACVGCNEAAGGGHDSVRHQLPEALRQLLAAVRLPLCSGAFLAGAVRRMPWLCAVLRHQHHSELHLLQQYYSANSHERYQLSLQLLQAGRSCPWSVPLRKATPLVPSLVQHDAANHLRSPGSRRNTLGACTRLSALRALLSRDTQQQQGSEVGQEGQPQPVPAVMVDKLVYGGFYWNIALIGMTAHAVTSGAGGKEALPQSDEAADDSKRLFLCVSCQPAWVDTLRELCGATLSSSGGGRGISSNRSPTGAYSPGSSGSTDGSQLRGSSAGQDYSSSNSSQDSDDDDGSHSPAYGIEPQHVDPTATAAAAAETQSVLAELTGDSSSTVCSKQQPGHCSSSGSSSCACMALHAIAAAKTAAAVARHSPIVAGRAAMPGLLAALKGLTGAPVSRAAFNSTNTDASGLRASTIFGKEASGGISANISTSSRTSSSSSSGSSSGHRQLDPRDVVVGVRLAAATCEVQLQDLVARGDTTHPGVSHAACLLPWDEAAGAAWGLIPIAVLGIGSSTNLLGGGQQGAAGAGAVVVGGPGGGAGGGRGPAVAGAGNAAGVNEARMQVPSGWDATLWSRLAPGGEVHWFCRLRMLSD